MTERDEKTLKALKENGSDLSKEHTIDFFLDFETFEEAAPVAQSMDKDGFEVKLNQLPPLPQLELGLYRHHKGGEYEVLGVVRHSETLEPMVLYRPVYNDSGLWVRPHAMFVEQVEAEGATQPRFTWVSPLPPLKSLKAD